MHDTYEVGDTVTYVTFMSNYRTGVVTAKHDDIKNGEPGFDMLDPSNPDGDTGFWGYDRQITSVISAKPQIPLVVLG